MEYYYKCKDLDSEFHEYESEDQDKEQIIGEIAEILYHDMGLEETIFDGDYIYIDLYDENKEVLENACVLMEIPEPTFTVQL